jgi:trypsin
MRKMASAVSLAVSCLLAGLAALATSEISLAEKIGTVTQPLVRGDEVSAEEQQSQGLVKINSKSGGCSGVLLNNEWVISAKHCFQDPDVTAGEVSVSVTWPAKQKKRTGRELYLFDKDIAIVRVDTPFDAISASFNMPVYTGTLSAGRGLKIYGRGIHALATGEGDAAQPTKSDGKYRSADFQVTRADGDHF